MSITSTTKQQLIVLILRRELDGAVRRRITACADRAATIAAANLWDDYNPEDGVGGLSQNPYRLDHVDKMETDAVAYLGRMQAAYDYAVDTFIGGEHVT